MYEAAFRSVVDELSGRSGEADGHAGSGQRQPVPASVLGSTWGSG